MSAICKKLLMSVCLSVCFGIILCILGYTRITSLFNMMEVGSKGQAPVRNLRITIDKSRREELFDQFRKLAEKNAFEFQISDYGTGGEDYLIAMSRNDITHNRC